MPIIKHITTIVMLIALHQSPVALAEDDETLPPPGPSQQNEMQPLPEPASEEEKQQSSEPITDTIESSPTDSSSIPQETDQKSGFVDRLHRDISWGILTTADWLDSFFEDDRVVKEENRSYIRARFDVFKEEGSSTTYKPTYNVRLSLPQLKKKAHLVISAETPEPAADNPAAVTVTGDRIAPTDERNVATSVNYIFRASEKRSSIVRVGAKLSHGSLVVFVAPRFRYFVPLTTWDIRFTQEATWKSDTDWQLDTLFDLERQLPHGLFFRTSLGGSWIEGTNGYFYSLSFSLRQPFDQKHALDYTWTNSFQTRPVNELEEILCSIRYRQNIWRDWFFFEIAPQIRFPRSSDFDGIPGILFRFEMYFGKNA